LPEKNCEGKLSTALAEEIYKNEEWDNLRMVVELYPKSIMGQPLVMCSFVRDYDFAWFCMISRIIALNNCLEFVIQGFFFGDTLSIFIQFNLYTVYRFIICILEAVGFGPESRHTQRPSRDLEWVIQKLLIPDRQFPISITLSRFDIAAHSYQKHDLWIFMMIYPLKNGLFLIIFLQSKRSKREGIRAKRELRAAFRQMAESWYNLELATR
jgi:hypothetical protein